MQTLNIDPAVPFLIPEHRTVTICLVGCGGTGSHIAQALARLAAHCRDSGGPQLMLGFVDGDVVEAKNVGRQLFSVADVGTNKAVALAGRFNAVFGLQIAAFAEMLDDERRLNSVGYRILVGAVDGASGRRALAKQLAQGWDLWIDCGNHESSGQVAVGNAPTPTAVAGALKLPGLCSKLPTAPVIYPELLKDAPIRPREDCAAAMQDNAQSLMVNQMMASIAAQYLYGAVVRRRLTTFQTVVDLDSLAMRSDPITATNLSRATGLTVAQLRGETTKKKGKQAA
jgi:PRTRC genetic system ThiF family protein